jgi:hypothetical protein
VGEAHEQEQLHKDASADTPTRLNTQDLWLKESTHVLKRPKSSAAVAEEGAMPKECLTRHYCQMTYDSILYNKEAAQKDPALLLTCVVNARGEEVPFTNECRLYGAPEADTRAHIYHTCRETATAREQLHAALTATVSKTWHRAGGSRQRSYCCVG